MACDASPAAEAALAWAMDYADGRDVVILLTYVRSSITEWEMAAIQVDPDSVRRHFNELLTHRWSARLRDRGLRYEPTLLVGRPSDSILRCAREKNADTHERAHRQRGRVDPCRARQLGRVLRHARQAVEGE